MKKTQFTFKLITLLIAISVSSTLLAQDNTTVYPSATTAAPGAAPIPAVNATPGNTLFDDGAADRWQSSPFLRSVNVGPFNNSGTAPLFPDFNIFRVGENYDENPVRMQVFGGNIVQTPSIVPFPSFAPATGRRYNAIGDRVPFSGSPAPGIRTTGLRSQWDLYAANFGLTDADSTDSTRNALISWQDATATNLDDVENRLVFGKRDQTTTNFEELATILGNGNMGIGIAAPLVKLQVQDGNIGQISDGDFGVIATGNRWSALGSRVPFGPSNPLIRQEGIRTQWGTNGVGLGLTDRSGSTTIKDAILTFQDANADFPNGDFSENNFIIGARDGIGGGGASAANVRSYFFIKGDNGNTAIGLNAFNPSAKLEVIGNGNTPSTVALSIQNGNNNSLLTTRDDGFTGIIVTSPISPVGNFSLGGSPTPTIPGSGTIFFSVEENMTASGSLFVGQDVYATSDARMKKDFKELSEDKDWKSLLNITPYSYKFDQDKVDNIKVDERTRYGFKAQDVAANIPELTKMWGDALVVNYQGFVPFLAAGIQEHEEEIEQVKEENEKISKENKDLKEQVKTLEEKLNDLYNLPAIQEAISQSKQTGSLDAQPKLYQNEPNPFGSKTIIRYFVPTTAQAAQIKVVDNSGAEMGSYKIKTGAGQLEITAATIPAGNYNYSLYIDNQLVDTKKMVIVNY